MSLINSTHLPRLNTSTLDDAFSWLRKAPQVVPTFTEQHKRVAKVLRFSDQIQVMASCYKKKTRENRSTVVKNPGELFAFSFIFNPETDSSYNNLEEELVDCRKNQPLRKPSIYLSIRRWLKFDDQKVYNCNENIAYETAEEKPEEFDRPCFMRRFMRSVSRSSSTGCSAVSKQSTESDENTGESDFFYIAYFG